MPKDTQDRGVQGAGEEMQREGKPGRSQDRLGMGRGLCC